MQWPIILIKNLTSLFPLIFLSKHISLYALRRLKWILDIIWPLNQYFILKNQRNWRTTFLMLSFLIGIICILLHIPKKLTLVKLPKVTLKVWPITNWNQRYPVFFVLTPQYSICQMQRQIGQCRIQTKKTGNFWFQFIVRQTFRVTLGYLTSKHISVVWIWWVC